MVPFVADLVLVETGLFRLKIRLTRYKKQRIELESDIYLCCFIGQSHLSVALHCHRPTTTSHLRFGSDTNKPLGQKAPLGRRLSTSSLTPLGSHSKHVIMEWQAQCLECDEVLDDDDLVTTQESETDEVLSLLVSDVPWTAELSFEEQNVRLPFPSSPSL